MDMIQVYNNHPKPEFLRRQMVRDNAKALSVLEGVERDVFIASTRRLFKEYTKEELLPEMATTLSLVMLDVGCRTGREELDYITIRVVDLVMRYYTNFSLVDFKMAFEMSLTGELDQFLPTGQGRQPERGHYQSFNAEYVSRILTAYRGYRARVINKALMALPKPAEPRDMREEEMYRRMKIADIKSAFRHWQEKGELPPMSPVFEKLAYDVLSAHGMTVPMEVTEEEQCGIIDRMAAAIAGKTGGRSFRAAAIEAAFMKIENMDDIL